MKYEIVLITYYIQYEHAIRYYNPQYYNSKYLLFIVFSDGFLC